MPLLVSLAILLGPLAVPECGSWPVEGQPTSIFDPGPGYRGHWGVDFLAPEGTPVQAVDGGTVTFAGMVVGNRAVTVNHGGSVRTSYSFLSEINVHHGETVAAGQVIGTTGTAHGSPGLHFSVRVGDLYKDPAGLARCGVSPHAALRLVGRRRAGALYAVPRAERDSGRHIRPPTCCALDGGRGCAQSSRAGRRQFHYRR